MKLRSLLLFAVALGASAFAAEPPPGALSQPVFDRLAKFPNAHVGRDRAFWVSPKLAADAGLEPGSYLLAQFPWEELAAGRYVIVYVERNVPRIGIIDRAPEAWASFVKTGKFKMRPHTADDALFIARATAMGPEDYVGILYLPPLPPPDPRQLEEIPTAPPTPVWP